MKSQARHTDPLDLTSVRLLLWIRTVSSGSSSCGRQVQSARGGAECPAAPLGSPSSPPRWAQERPPARHPGSGRRGTCPGSSAPGPLGHNKPTRTAGLVFRISASHVHVCRHRHHTESHHGWEHPLPAAPATCPQPEYESGRRSSAASASRPTPSPHNTAWERHGLCDMLHSSLFVFFF